ncbi:hypothetical protein [Streptomyces sp. NPDC059909]|uniref:hypothetical protein n=1 Tax=Streptomyces sp. NPDC059909 TaxID=3346998 RepID=UPI0036624506
MARRVDIRHLPLAKVELTDDHNRVFYVIPGRSNLEVVPLPSRRRMSRIAALTAACLTAMVVVMLLVR